MVLVGGELEVENPTLERDGWADFPAVAVVPELDGSVMAGGGDMVGMREEGSGHDGSAVDDGWAGEGGLGSFPDLGGFGSAYGEEVFAIRVEAGEEGPVGVGDVGCGGFAGCQVDEFDAHLAGDHGAGDGVLVEGEVEGVGVLKVEVGWEEEALLFAVPEVAVLEGAPGGEG